MTELNERVLEDNYPVHYGYMYVAVQADGLPDLVIRSRIAGTVKDLIRDTKKNGGVPGVTAIKSCDIGGRGLFDKMV